MDAKQSFNEDEVKRVSLLLFRDIKPVCIELSQLALLPPTVFSGNDSKLTRLLSNLVTIINSNVHSNSSNGPYIIASGLADYIFFPISNLLKQSALAPEVILQIFNIIDLLLNHCWVYNLQMSLVDQLFPLVVFLVGDESKAGQTKSSHSLEFNLAAAKVLKTLIQVVPDNYFGEEKLPLLASVISVNLGFLNLSSCSSTEEISLVLISCANLKRLYGSMSGNQLSQVLPGNMSHLVNFTSNVGLINYEIIVKILDLLKYIIIKVFNDKDLNISYNAESISLDDIASKWDSMDHDMDSETGKHQPLLSIQLNNDPKIRTKSWLVATATQLKISLIVLFKNILLSDKNRIKVKTKSQIGEGIKSFVSDIMTSCFISLFDEFTPLAIDILSLYISTTDQESQNIKELSPVFSLVYDYSEDSSTKKKLIYKMIKVKLQDLIENKLPIVIKSTDEDKINNCFVSIKFQLNILHDLTSILKENDAFLQKYELNLLQVLKNNLVDNFELKKRESSKKPSIESSSDNKLDEIELPPYINAKQIAKYSQPAQTIAGQATYNTSLVNFSKQLKTDLVNKELESSAYFSNTFSSFIETKISLLIEFCASKNDTSQLTILENVLTDGSLLQNAVGMWIANNYLKISAPFKIDEFLQFEDPMEVDDANSESTYLVLAKAQELMDKVHENAHEVEDIGGNTQITEFSYSVALDAIGTISKSFTLVDFQTDFMIEYLLPLLEALTMNQHPLIQAHAVSSVKEVTNTFYGGSLEALLVDNLDYLIDSINLKLSSSDLTPSLPGILLVIIRYAGIKLLLSNQLNDIMNQIFITIDTYHGYSRMVEGYFIVFNELVQKISGEYNVKLLEHSEIESAYKPWGITNVDGLISLLTRKEPVVDDTYEPDKEYFEKSEREVDSDDESDEEEHQMENTPVPWTSIVPQNTYNLALSIFSYGFKLLSQNGTSLKMQILKTLVDVYPILCTNYNMLTVQVINEYPILLSLLAGTTSLSTYQVDSIEVENLIAPALNLALLIIEQDDSPDRRCLGRQFTEAWSFLSKHSPLFRSPNKSFKTFHDDQVVKHETALVKVSNPKTRTLFCKFILTGINCYSRSIADVTKMEMLQICIQLGLPAHFDYCQEVKNILWVMKHHTL